MPTKRKRVAPSEAAFDLAGIRKAKRLAKRVVRALEVMERAVLRFQSRPRQGKAAAEEIRIATEMYAAFADDKDTEE